jgi:pimeloyl-ACP methyl ester carboxylesterase
MHKVLFSLTPILCGLLWTIVSAQQAAEPAGKFVVVNGSRLWYRIAGQGTPLLLIPGGPGSSHTYFYPGLERLSDSFQVIFFDAFGRGRSDRPTAVPVPTQEIISRSPGSE